MLTSSRLIGFLVCVVATCACSTSPKPAPEKGPEVTVAFRQIPHEPVYNRLRWVHLPSVIPPESPAFDAQAPLILPIMHFTLKNGTLYEAASMLAASTHYSSYCSSLIANRKISIEKIGTVEEIAAYISKIAHINALVDHNSREVRFTAAAPSALSSRAADPHVHSQVTQKVLGYEHRSDNASASL